MPCEVTEVPVARDQCEVVVEAGLRDQRVREPRSNPMGMEARAEGAFPMAVDHEPCPLRGNELSRHADGSPSRRGADLRF